ncbi:glycoside hydrolase family 16 protein [Mycena albidolilacea]|uniref:Glycoside hydrolase family 16 protein n=1 Tax=Mycena albidolilacea TaxID=1033008 RepID=A0AAD7ARE6_9AGAR|nr:glycoside hydrolase family 16 protein [Mycena albidolilacea]
MKRTTGQAGQYAPVPSASSLAPLTPNTASSHTPASLRESLTNGVATGEIGAGYGPYSYPQPNRDSAFSSSRFSNAASMVPTEALTRSNTSTLAPQFWDTDPDLDDALHNPDRDDSSFTFFSLRGWLNASALFILCGGLIVLFAGYPVISSFGAESTTLGASNLGGINKTGQVPDLIAFPSPIDKDTPTDAYSRTGVTDGKKYNLIFSDEFETDGRSFYPGDDPYWEGVDLHYWPTGDLEWYDPGAVTTENGKLVITMTEQNYHDLNFKSGMIQTWNKFCFTTGYIEVKVSFPGTPNTPGFWPGAWTMGNLGRAGYGATTEGMWPYSYDTCDVGTVKNQTNKDGTPAATATGGSGNTLSFLPGQRTSACTCPGEDHPGPSVSKGRGVPEIDILEAQIDVKQSPFEGQVSQSFQVAPFNLDWNFDNASTTFVDDTKTKWNGYRGSQTQQAVSALTYIPSSVYSDQDYGIYGLEYWSDPDNRDDGYITWFASDTESWSLKAGAVGPDTGAEIGPRLIPEEPMYLILNFGMSPGFQHQDFEHMTFPNKMYVDYIRVYQRDGVSEGATCNPSKYPTSDYINKHINAYTDANLTIWSEAGYTFPKNSIWDGC